MIYRDVDVKLWAEKHHIKLETEKCHWGCDSNMTPRPIETTLSWGIRYECGNCECVTYTARPKDQEFWDTII